MTKALIITYYWPPAGGPGVQRWLKFSKYLLENDIQPIVLTVDPEFGTYPIIDESLEKEVPQEIKVYRTETRELFGAYKKATNRNEIPYSGFASEEKQPGFKEKLARFIRGNFFYPDPRRAWKRFAVVKAREIIASDNVSIIITTGPPHSTHLIGLQLKKQLGVAWIADFRDPWTDIYYYNDFYPTAWVRRKERSLESKVLNTADKITTASPGFGKMLAGKVSDPKKIWPITNGYDEEDLPTTKTIGSSEKVQITYSGTLTEKYPLHTFVDGLKKLNKADQENICFNLVGKADNYAKNLLSASEIHFEINFRGYVSHSEVMGILAASDFLLLLIPTLKGNEGIIPAKLFEYIGSGKQIIGVGPLQSDAANIVDENSFGQFFDVDDAEGLNLWIRQKLTKPITAANATSGKREKYSRRYLTARLAGLIKDLVS